MAMFQACQSDSTQHPLLTGHVGAAILAHSLRDAGTTKKLAAMVTLESVSSAAITELKVAWARVCKTTATDLD